MKMKESWLLIAILETFKWKTLRKYLVEIYV